jgi:hypothetical protein
MNKPSPLLFDLDYWSIFKKSKNVSYMIKAEQTKNQPIYGDQTQ